MNRSKQKTRFRFWMWLIRLIGVIVPRRMRREWQQEWEAELRYRETLLEEWDRLDWRLKLDLLWRSTSAFWDALWLQTYRWEDAMIQDLRFAVRMLQKNLGFTLVAVFVLALAMGANTAIFSVIEGVLLRPLPYHDADRLCVLWKSVPARNIEWDWTSYPTIRDWEEQSHAFEEMAVVLRPEGSLFTFADDTGREIIQGSKVSGNFFELLGVKPLFGRTFSSDETRLGAEVVVLSYGFWQQRFGADRTVLGRTLQLDSRSATIVGVMSADFQFPDSRTQLWSLLTADSRWAAFQQVRFADAFCALARLKAGVSIEGARYEMSAIAERLAREQSATDADLSVRVLPLSDQIAGARVRRALWILGGAALCVLLIACSNIASLLLARAAVRQKELAVRAAMGAGRGRLLRQLATENILLSMMGGILGLFVASWGLQALLALVPESLPRTDGIAINGSVLAFTFGLCLLTGLVFGLLPASRIAGKNLVAHLRDGSRTTAASLGIQRLRGLLVTLQLALAIVLLTGAGLLIRSFLLLDAVKPGFDTSHLLSMTLQLPEDKYEDDARRQAFFADTIQKIEVLPGVRGAAVGYAVFDSLSGHVPNQNLVVEGQPATQDVERHGRNTVSDDYFRVLGIPLRQGRLFSTEDRPGSQPAAVINETMARRCWPDENPLGKRFKEVLPGMDGPWVTVVGVVGDVVYNRDGSVIAVFYNPLRQQSWSQMGLVVRTAVPPLNLAAAVRQAVRVVDAAVPNFEITTVEQALAKLDRPRRSQTLLLGVSALTALILAALGLYGLLSYLVEQRTQEIGIRVALGAQRSDVLKLLIGQGMALVLTGVVTGLIASLALTRWLESLLFGVSATDPLTFIGVALLLIAVALLACYLPARRACRVDPLVALQHE